jgi:hypothetical protein
VLFRSNQPIFKILRTINSYNINGNSGSGDIPVIIGSNLEKVKFSNLILSDNLNGTANSGNCTLSSTPMISVERGANFECENVSFWGRLNDGSVVTRGKTRHAVATTSGSANGTSVSIKNCYFDGVCNPINFNTQLGDLDFLTIESNKFRFYGLEGLSLNTNLDCLIFASQCNLSIKNNYAVGAVSNARIFLTLGATGGSTSNIKSIISDNNGYTLNSVSPIFIQNNTSNATLSIKFALSNNTWSLNNILDDKWRIKISSSFTGLIKDCDLFGVYSLNSLIQYASLQAEVIIDPGVYTISLASSTISNLSLVGSEFSPPTVSVNITGGSTDNLGNYYLSFSKYIKNINFIRSIDDAGVSIYCGWSNNVVSAKLENNNNIIIDNSSFSNLTLRTQNSMTTENDEGRINYSLLINNCSFDSYPGSGLLNLAIAPNYTTTISNSYFRSLAGYAISYGSALYTSPTNSNGYVSNLIIKDVIIDLDSSDATFGEASSPFELANGSARSYLIDIDDGGSSANQNTNLLIDNLKVRIDSNDSELLSNAFYTSLDVRRFMNISTYTCNILNSKFEIPYHTYTNSGTKAIAGVYITIKNDINISNNLFFGGSNGLKIVFPSGQTYYPGNINVNNNTFRPTFTGDLATRTMLDIDMTYQATPDHGKIKVHNNQFFIKKTGELYPADVQYTYKTYGAVQINAPGWDVDFESNQVRTTQIELTDISEENLAGVFINTSKNNASLVNRFTYINCYNNSINIENVFDIGGSAPDDAANVYAALWCEGTIINVNNNILNYQNLTSIGTGYKTDLCIECTNVGTSGDYVVSNNMFSRAERSGAMANYLNSYIHLQNTDVYGRIVDNSFVNADPSGLATYTDYLSIGSGVTSLPKLDRNKNQRKTVTYSGYGFQASLDSAIINNNPLEDHRIESTVATSMGDSSDPVWALYYVGDDSVTYRLFAPLDQLIPIGAHLLSASAAATIDSLIDVSLVTLKLYNMTDNISVTSNQLNFASVTSGTATLSNATRAYTSGEDKIMLMLEVTANSVSSVSRLITISSISITYQY